MFTMETARLIERCRQGDADALGELYKAYAQRMRGVCRRYISDEQAVDDVLHDAFVIIFTSFDRLRDNRKAESWMMSITRNVASKCKEQMKGVTMVPIEEAATLSQHTEQADVRGVPLEDVLRMVERLPKGYEQVFRLSVFEGLSHKEIAAMLGIEPHSSSSQLARAKKMLRKMMQHYWAAVLLLLLVPVGIWLLHRKDKPEPVGDSSRVVATADSVSSAGSGEPTVTEREPRCGSEQLAEEIPTTEGRQLAEGTSTAERLQSTDESPTTERQTQPSTVEPSPLDNRGYAQHIPGEEQSAGDSTLEECPFTQPIIIPSLADLFPDKPVVSNSHSQRWSLELAYAGQYDKQSSYLQPYTYKPASSDAMSDPTLPSTTVPTCIDNWTDYAVYLANTPDAASPQSRSVIMNIALNNANRPGNDKILRTSHHRMPVTWSLALKYRLNNRFALETGLSYSRLASDFEMGTAGNVIREQQTIHYLGIPVKGILNIYDRKAWSLYGSLGVTTEIPVHSPLNTSYYLHGALEATDQTTLRAPWQWSVGTGLGLQYNLTPNIGLFAEPSLQYYIPTGSDIETYRTEHPFTFSLPLGIRFTW